MLFEENFTIFVVSYGAICGTRHVESVFALSLTENVEVFNNNGTNEQHSFLFRLWPRCVYADTPYLFECGVLHRLSLLRSFHNLQLDRRNNSTLSFYKLMPFRGWMVWIFVLCAVFMIISLLTLCIIKEDRLRKFVLLMGISIVLPFLMRMI